MKVAFATLFAVAAADTCSLYEIADGSCGQSDLDCAYTKYAKAAEKGLADGTCSDQGYSVKTGTQTKTYPVIGDIVITTYSQGLEVGSCKGSADPADISADTCYSGSAGALGLKETVTVTIHNFASSKGSIDVVGSGIEDISCKNKDVSKSGQDLSTDLSDCLPSAVEITAIKYCSDSDEISVTVKDKSVPLPVSATLKKVDCGSVTDGLDEMWAEFTSVHGAQNGDDRKAIFAENVKKAVEHNRKQTGSLMGVQGPFAAMTLDEFQSANIRGFASAKSSGLPNLGMHEDSSASATVDWTTKGAVTKVKDQGQCGSCWAFSTTGGLEGSFEIASGNLVSMSEQQFVDCDTGSAGCNGGSMEGAFQWAESHAVATEGSYAYTARDGSCKSRFTTAIPSGGVTGYKQVGSSASSLESAIQQQPVSVAIEADQSVFQMYSGGVITTGCGTNLDHGVLAVGINSDGSIKVKNSWGSSWGANGYVNIATNQCGITSDASYPVVSGAVSV
jgi:C1A family cysteine protease